MSRGKPKGLIPYVTIEKGMASRPSPFQYNSNLKPNKVKLLILLIQGNSNHRLLQELYI